jgi:hypothetical protein
MNHLFIRDALMECCARLMKILSYLTPGMERKVSQVREMGDLRAHKGR